MLNLFCYFLLKHCDLFLQLFHPVLDLCKCIIFPLFGFVWAWKSLLVISLIQKLIIMIFILNFRWWTLLRKFSSILASCLRPIPLPWSLRWLYLFLRFLGTLIQAFIISLLVFLLAMCIIFIWLISPWIESIQLLLLFTLPLAGLARQSYYVTIRDPWDRFFSSRLKSVFSKVCFTFRAVNVFLSFDNFFF